MTYSRILIGAFAFVACAKASTINAGSFTCNAVQDPAGTQAFNGASVTVQSGCQFGSTAAAIGLQVSDTSSLNMSAGSIIGSSGGNGLNTNGTGIIIVSGGTISSNAGWEVQGNYNANPITISGGLFQGDNVGGFGLDTLFGNSSIVNISGGTFTARDGIRAGASSTINISSGTVGNASTLFGIVAEGSSTVNINGGVFQGTLDALFAQNNGIINVYGSGLQLSGGHVIGTLRSGEAINAKYSINGSSQINLIQVVPEPVSLAMMAGGLLLLAILRRNRRPTSA